MRIEVPIVPASFFGMVIGLVGLGTAWRWAHQVWGLPAVVGEAIIWLSIAVWVGLTILYIAKWSVARDDASAEVADFRRPHDSRWLRVPATRKAL